MIRYKGNDRNTARPRALTRAEVLPWPFSDRLGWETGLLAALLLAMMLLTARLVQAQEVEEVAGAPAPPSREPPSPQATVETASPLTDSLAPVAGWPYSDSRPLSVAYVTAAALPSSDGIARRVSVPILMYHYISDPPSGSDAVRRDLSLPGPDFEIQLRYLANEGYHTISLYDLVMYLQQGIPLPEKPIILTFDDGYKDAYTVAFPLLQEYGFTGTFFVFTQPINEENRDYLSWREIELMSAAGMEFGSHSHSHPDLRGKSPEALEQEVIVSKETIEAHIHQPVRFFCYPSGAYDNRLVKAVKEAGYWGAVTTAQGIEHTSGDLYTLHRIRVRGEAGLEYFDALLNLDW